MKAIAVFAENDNKPILITNSFHRIHEIVKNHFELAGNKLLKPIIAPDFAAIFQSTDLLQKWIVREIIVETFLENRVMKHEERIYCYCDVDGKIRYCDFYLLPLDQKLSIDFLGFILLNQWGDTNEI